MRRAKIVCTLGPATSSPERIRELVDAGMDVARLNLSHGTYADHEEIYRRVRRPPTRPATASASSSTSRGPRSASAGSGGLDPDPPGQSFTITTRDVAGNNEIARTTYQGLPGDVAAGDQILIDDGKVRLRVTEVDGDDVHTVVVTGGRVSDNKGINLPGVAVSVPGDVGEGHRGPALGAAPDRRLHRAVVRALGRRRRGRPRRSCARRASCSR